METIFSELVKQIPWGVVCITIVYMFLKAQKENGEQNRAMLKEFHQDHLTARGDTAKAIAEKAMADVEIAKALTLIGESVRSCSFKPIIQSKHD